MSTHRFSRSTCILVSVGFFFVSMFYLYRWHYTGDCVNTNSRKEISIMTVPVLHGKIHTNRKYAVFSTTSERNAKSLSFLFLVPLTALAWKRIGFDSMIIIIGSKNLWNCDPLLFTVLNRVLELDAVVIFLDAHPENSVMVSQVGNTCRYKTATIKHICLLYSL